MSDEEFARLHARLGRDPGLAAHHWEDFELLFKIVRRLKEENTDLRRRLGAFEGWEIRRAKEAK